MDKTMKNKVIYFGKVLFGSFLLLTMTAGCSDLLNKQPKDQASNETYWRTKDDAVQAVNETYRYLTDIRFDIFLSAATDDSYAWSTWPVPILSVGNGSAATTNGVFNHYWSHSYEGIARANNVLDHIDQISDSELSSSIRARLKAEVRFLRAYYYQELIMMFGDVPLIKHIQSSDEFEVPRTAKEKVADFIVNEMNDIAKDLPLEYSGSDKGRVTRGAAMALKARVLLYQEKWPQAAKAAKAVMNLGEYSIDQGGYRSLFDGTNKDSNELILVGKYKKNTYANGVATWMGGPSLGGWSEVVPLQSLVDTYECTDGKTIDNSSLYDPDHPFKNRDPRLKKTIITPGDTVNGNVIDVTKPNSIDALGETNASFTGYYYKKYIPADIDGAWYNNSHVDEVHMRYAEVLLNYAEAKIEAGDIDQSVYSSINKVRQRKGVDMPPLNSPMSQSDLRKAVHRERHVEFAGEPFIRLFDIRRWKKAEDVMPGTVYGIKNDFDQSRADYGKHVQVENRTFDPKKDYLWPIPQNEMDLNSKLTQNKGW